MDFSPTFGCVGTHSLSNSADEEFQGSFAAIASAIISLCRKTNMPVYIRIAEALKEMDASQLAVPLCASAAKVKEVSDKLHSYVSNITDEELLCASQLVNGHKMVEVPGLEHRTPSAPEPMRPPEPRGMADYLTAPCTHECTIFKQRRHIRQAHSVLVSLDPIRSALMRKSAG
jgi:hypothetical protein